MRNKKAGSGLPLLLAACFGALNTLSFAPTPRGGWLEILIFIALFALLTRTRGWCSAALLGLAFGFGNFVTGVWWLYVSMHTYGGMPAPMAGTALALFSMYLGFYPMIACALWRLLTPLAGTAPGQSRGGWVAALMFASAWAFGEWLRGTVFTGFPWLASGYAQVGAPLSGFASLLGVYGIGWVLALVAALAAQALGVSRAAAAPARMAERLAPGLAAVALLSLGLALSTVHWTRRADAPALSVRLLQGDVPQDMKFSQAGFEKSVDLYQRLITAAPADLIVTPETAVPVFMQDIPPTFANAVRNFSDITGSSILLGTVGGTLTAQGPVDLTNSILGITPHEVTLFRYDKNHLVPFGEFIPWGFHWFIRMMKMPLGDFSRGPPVQEAFEVRGERIAVDICYEDIFGEEIARTLREQKVPASILVNSTNLAWFGNTIALDQHLQIARMRSLETERPMLRSTNTGTTAAIDAEGRVLGRLPPFTVGTLSTEVHGTVGLTPYVRFGNVPVLALSLAILALGLLFRIGKVAKARRSR